MDIFVGYDSSTVEAFLACTGSIRENSMKVKPNIYPLCHRELRKKGLFYRQWDVDETGQWWDKEDGRPFSTEFSFSRFCTIPWAREMGINDWVMFCDSDFLFLHDPKRLFEYAENYPDKALLVRKFDWQPDSSQEKKMDGRLQTSYNKKLWSSLMMINMKHPSNIKLTTEMVNTATGSKLHGFEWLDEDEIGNINEQWNWIDGVSRKNVIPSAVHYSMGLPSHPGYEDTPYAAEWWSYLFRELDRRAKSKERKGFQE